MQSLRLGWLRPTLIYASVFFFLFWTIAPVLWIGIMSVQPEINYVSVPPRLSLLRTSYMASHRQEHLDRALRAFKVVDERLDLVQNSALLADELTTL